MRLDSPSGLRASPSCCFGWFVVRARSKWGELSWIDHHRSACGNIIYRDHAEFQAQACDEWQSADL